MEFTISPAIDWILYLFFPVSRFKFSWKDGTEVLKNYCYFIEGQDCLLPMESEILLALLLIPFGSLLAEPLCCKQFWLFCLKVLTVFILFSGVPVHLERQTDHEFSGVSSGTSRHSPRYVSAGSSMTAFKSKLAQEHGVFPATVTCLTFLAIVYLGISQHFLTSW